MAALQSAEGRDGAGLWGEVAALQKRRGKDGGEMGLWGEVAALQKC